MAMTGRCLCGSVTYSADDVATDAHSCHCGMCRRWNGGPALAVGVGKVNFNNDKIIKRYSSSDWAERGFCSACGTNLFYRLKEADRYFLWLGTFDDQAPFNLKLEIYIDEKPSTYDLAGERTRLTGDEFIASLNQ